MVACEFSSPLYVTSGDIDRYYGGNRYDSNRPLSIGKVSGGAGLSVARVDFQIGNADLIPSSIIFNSGILGEWCTISFMAIGDTGQEIASYDLFKGMVDDFEVLEDAVKITIANELLFWNKSTGRESMASCPWPFMGTECGYAGTGTCDQTYDKCAELGNTVHFGGDRWLPSIQEKKIWWGPKG